MNRHYLMSLVSMIMVYFYRFVTATQAEFTISSAVTGFNSDDDSIFIDEGSIGYGVSSLTVICTPLEVCMILYRFGELATLNCAAEDMFIVIYEWYLTLPERQLLSASTLRGLVSA